VYRGRKKALRPDQEQALKRWAAAEESKTFLACEFSISRETLYQYLRER